GHHIDLRIGSCPIYSSSGSLAGNRWSSDKRILSQDNLAQRNICNRDRDCQQLRWSRLAPEYNTRRYPRRFIRTYDPARLHWYTRSRSLRDDISNRRPKLLEYTRSRGPRNMGRMENRLCHSAQCHRTTLK